MTILSCPTFFPEIEMSRHINCEAYYKSFVNNIRCAKLESIHVTSLSLMMMNKQEGKDEFQPALE